MEKYTYYDFLEILDDTGKRVTETIHNHISRNHPAYKPYGIQPKDKTKQDWSLYFRKSPKHGKALCSLFSVNGALCIRFILYSPMIHEALLRQDEFGEKIRTGILRSCSCKSCGYYGDKEHCWCQHHYYIANELRYSCNTAWYTIDNIKEGDLAESDINDLLFLSDLQSKHMSHSAKESRGAMYEEENLRCGTATVVNIRQMKLDIDVFDPADYADIKRLNRYAESYNLTPMGAGGGGLWFYFDDKAVCGTLNEGYAFTNIPEGCYAMITITNPFTFSVARAWDYICMWARKNNSAIASVDIGGIKSHMFTKFYKQGANHFMEMYVPIKP